MFVCVGDFFCLEMFVDFFLGKSCLLVFKKGCLFVFVCVLICLGMFSYVCLCSDVYVFGYVCL